MESSLEVMTRVWVVLELLSAAKMCNDRGFHDAAAAKRFAPV